MDLSVSRLKVGVDVPWVTSWSDEEVLGARPCLTTAGQLAIWQAERPGMGKPQYSKNHFNRQRASVSAMLCPMCGKPTAQGDRWTQQARRVAAGALRAKGLGHVIPADADDDLVLVDAGSVAPLHLACARFSLDQCPHLRAYPAIDLRPFPERWAVAPLVFRTGPPPGQNVLMDPVRAPQTAIAFLQLCGVTRERDRHWRSRLS